MIESRLDELCEGVDEYVEENGMDERAYAMAIDTIAQGTYEAFQYMCKRLGATEPQAVEASQMSFRRIRDIDGPFSVVRLEAFLSPDSEPLVEMADFLNEDEVVGWLRDKASELLKSQEAPADLKAHWRMIAQAPDKKQLWQMLSGMMRSFFKYSEWGSDERS